MTLKLVSREYKLLLDHREFRERKEGVATYSSEVIRLANPLKTEGQLEKVERRSLAFLDTPDHTLHRFGLVLRHRSNGEEEELTLKCRSEDRYFVAGTDLRASADFKAKQKLEEDIAAPFISRYSRSNTVKSQRPKTWGAAAEIFPLLGELQLDGHSLANKIVLTTVNELEVFERVYTGLTIFFPDSTGSEKTTKATTALILWSDGKEGRPLVAEFSFRIKDREEEYSRSLASEARILFEKLQRHDWCAPRGVTKTQFAYGNPGTL